MNDCSNCTAELCVIRNRKLPASMLTTCKRGQSEQVDKLLVAIEAARASRRESRKDQPFTKMANLRRAPPSPPSTIGTLLFAALEDSGHRGTLTTRCRNFVMQLNQPQRHDAESITDRLMDELRYESVQNVRKPRQGPKGRETIAELVRQAIRDDAEANPRPSKPAELPDVSDIGTRLKSAIETAGDFTMSCGHCLSYLRSLNKSTHNHTDTILDGLLLHGELPQSVRDRVGGIKAQREWLRMIAESVIHAE